MNTAAKLAEYNQAVQRRNEIISHNRAERMRRVKTGIIPVPPKPEAPTVPIAYDKDGHYVGRLNSVDECPEGCVIKWERALY